MYDENAWYGDLDTPPPRSDGLTDWDDYQHRPQPTG